MKKTINSKKYAEPGMAAIYAKILKGWEKHPLYEQWVQSGENGVNYILNSEAIDKMAQNLECSLEEAKILDMGCGTGNGIIAFNLLGAKDCVGIDISLKGLGLNLARSRLKKLHIPARLICASGLNLPFEDGVFDLVFSHNVIEHVKCLSPFLSEMHRVLKPGGIGLIGTPNRIWPRDSHFALLFAPWLPNRLLKFYATLRGRRRQSDEWSLFLRTPWTIIRSLRKAGFEILATTSDYMKPKEESINKFRRRIIDNLLNIGVKIDYFFPIIRVCVRKTYNNLPNEAA